MGGLPCTSQIPKSAERATAKTAERNPTAVMAVPETGDPEILRASIGSNGSAPAAQFQNTEAILTLTAAEERELRAWLSHIEETDEAIIAHVLNQCRTDTAAHGYFLRRADEVPPPDILEDDRRRCDQCANLTERGLCLAARRGKIVASRDYEPIRNFLRRCEGYAPGANDADRRPGCERWPVLTQKRSDDASN